MNQLARKRSHRPMNNVKVLGINRHRNGISGRAFDAVEFEFNEVGETHIHRLLAVLPVDARSDSECYVISIDNPSSEWRGDTFSAEMQRLIKEHQA